MLQISSHNKVLLYVPIVTLRLPVMATFVSFTMLLVSTYQG